MGIPHSSVRYVAVRAARAVREGADRAEAVGVVDLEHAPGDGVGEPETVDVGPGPVGEEDREGGRRGRARSS